MGSVYPHPEAVTETVSSSARLDTANEWEEQQRFVKNAITYDDLSFPLTQGRQGSAGTPAYDFDELGYLFPQNDATEKLYLSVQLPHRWEEGATLYPHVHWHQSADAPVTWKIDYRWTNPGELVASEWQTAVMDDLAFEYPGSGVLHQISGGLALAATGKTISSELQIVLYRDDNVYTGDALATMFDIHITSDALGSAGPFTK